MKLYSIICLLLFLNINTYSTTLNLKTDFTTKNQITLSANWDFNNLNNSALYLKFNDNANITISEIKLNNDPAEYVWENNLITIKNPTESTVDNIEIIYIGNPNSLSNFGIDFESGEDYYIASCSSFPDGLCEWLPVPILDPLCFKLNHKITTLPIYTAIGNGNLISKNTFEDKVEFEFETESDISPYQIYFRIASQTATSTTTLNLNSKTIEFNIYPFPGYSDEAFADFSNTENIISTLENYFGEFPYSFLNASVFNFSKVFSTPNNLGIYNNFITGEGFHSEKIVNGIAGQWWGSNFIIKNFNHAFVTQGLKTYSEILFQESQENTEKSLSSLDFCGTLLSNYDLGDTSLYEPLISTGVDPFLHPYVLNNKGAYFFHMLRNKVSDDLFFKSLKNLNSLKDFNLNDTDLLQFAFEKTCKKDFSEFFRQWCTSPSRPYLFYSIHNENNLTILDINQVQEQNILNGQGYFLKVDLVNENERLTGFVNHMNQKLIFDNENNLDFQLDPTNNLLKSTIKSEESLIEGNIDFSVAYNYDSFPYVLTIEHNSNDDFNNYEILLNDKVISTSFPALIKIFESGDSLITVTGIKENGDTVSRIKKINISNVDNDVNEDGIFTLSDISKVAKSIYLNDLSGDLNNNGESNGNDLKLIAFNYDQKKASSNENIFLKNENSTSITLENQTENISVGKSFSINILLNSETQINTVLVKLLYDNKKVKPLKISNNSCFTNILYSKNHKEEGFFEILITDTGNTPLLEKNVLCTVDFMPLSSSDNFEIYILGNSTNNSQNSKICSFENGASLDFDNSSISLNTINEEKIFPLILENENTQSTIIWVNPNTETVQFEIKSFSKEGNQLETSAQHINGKSKLSLNVFDIFENTAEVSSLIVTSNQHLPSFMEIKDLNEKYSFAYPGSTQFDSKINVTHIDESQYWNTYLSVMNSGTSSSKSYFKSNEIPGVENPYSSYFGRISGIFENNEMPSNVNWGVVESETGELAGAEFFLRVDSQTHAAGLTLNNEKANTLYFSHIDITNFWWTGIAIVNPNDEKTSVTFQAYDKFGNSILNSENKKGQVSFDIQPNSKTVNLIENYFEQKLSQNAAWIKVVSELPITGYEVFGSVEGSFADLAAGIESVSSGSFEFYLPVNMDDEENKWTGLALLNLSTDLKADEIIIKGYSENGELTGLKYISLNPNEKKVFLLRDIFSSDTLSNISWMEINSTIPITGFTLFGPETMQSLSGINLLN